MSPEHDEVLRTLCALPAPALSPALRVRALARARGHLAGPPGVHAPFAALPAFAAPAALLSADAVFLADACLKMGRAFGG
jgi:hypothetical protein